MMLIPWIWLACFIVGNALFIFSLLVPLYQRRGATVAIQQMIQRYRRISYSANLPDEREISQQERVYKERARSAGVTWSYRSFRLIQQSIAFTGGVFAYLQSIISFDFIIVRALLVSIGIGIVLWGLPIWLMKGLAMQRRTQYLYEITKFAHRLSICMTENADIRELMMRSGRPLQVLKPHILKMAGQWGNDQREAIMTFKDDIGIPEIYPLVNALMALSRAKASDVARLLGEHSKSIDATLQSELTKRMESAPVWISFYIMIPFFICLFLFLYPWMLTVLEQLTTSFSVG
jgi:hypothetical protein